MNSLSTCMQELNSPGTREGTAELRCAGTGCGLSARLAWLNRPVPHWYTHPESEARHFGFRDQLLNEQIEQTNWDQLTSGSERMPESCSYPHHRLLQTLRTKKHKHCTWANSSWGSSERFIQLGAKTSRAHCWFAHIDKLKVCRLWHSRSNTKLPKRVRATWQNSTTVCQKDRIG